MGFRFLLDSVLHVADAVTEAPAARDVDDARSGQAVNGRAFTFRHLVGWCDIWGRLRPVTAC